MFKDKFKNVSIFSEVNPLKDVIIHPPGNNHAIMIPENVDPAHPDYLLYEDLVYLPRMIDEYKQFKSILETVSKTWDINQLIEETLFDPEAKNEVIDKVSQDENLDHGVKSWMDSLTPKELTQVFIVGTDNGDIDGKKLMNPLPNFTYTRDIGVVIGDKILLTYANKKARKREMLLSRSVFNFHPLFKDVEVLDINALETDSLCIEGGDLVLLNENNLLIGVSERTSLEAVKTFSRLLFEKEIISRIYIVEIPKQRASMHLDTIFTCLDHHECLVFAPMILNQGGSKYLINIYRLEKEDLNFQDSLGNNLIEVLERDEIKINPILCGGNKYIDQLREQWMDGSNLFALAPGVVIGYDRNECTFRELEKHGYCILNAEDYLKNFQYYLGSRKKIAIRFGGSELIRGRGGPRCMTMPFRRLV